MQGAAAKVAWFGYGLRLSRRQGCHCMGALIWVWAPAEVGQRGTAGLAGADRVHAQQAGGKEWVQAAHRGCSDVVCYHRHRHSCFQAQQQCSENEWTAVETTPLSHAHPILLLLFAGFQRCNKQAGPYGAGETVVVPQSPVQGVSEAPQGSVETSTKARGKGRYKQHQGRGGGEEGSPRLKESSTLALAMPHWNMR